MPRVQIEESLHDALKETDLLFFQHKLAAEKQLTKIEHFDHVTDDELKSYGLSAPAVRRLRNALDRKKKNKKSKLFSKSKPSKFINADCESPTSASAANMPSTSQASTSALNAPCLISRDDVTLMEKLGEGGFATVKRGVWQRGGSLVKVDCAVKVLHQLSAQAVEDLHAEIAHMQKLKHQNVIQLYGIVFGEPTMLVIEFCNGGSLLDRLRNTKKSVLLVTKLLSYAFQIASGMAYLENRHVIHRDLALRNILLAENEEIAKICDFGMTRSLEENARLYVMSGQKKVPFGWCPPESLRFRQFSHKSDCWAFGVTLWELYTYGEEPWIGYRAADVLRVTEEGEQLKKPRKCLQEIYEIMQMCWNLEPELRPKFSHLRNLLLDIKFMTAETRESYLSDDSDSLELSIGEHVIIISEDAQKEWYGQSTSSRKFGKFPHSLVSVKSHRVSDMPSPSNAGISSPTALAAMSSTNSAYQKGRSTQISKPIPGSLIHTGHGDIDKDKCWGNVDRIDEIYLKNPVTRPPPMSVETRSHGVSFISSITALHDDFLNTQNTSSKVRPVSSNFVKLDFDPLKAWDLPTPPIFPSAVKTSVSTKPLPPPASRSKATSKTTQNSVDVLESEFDKWNLDRPVIPPAPSTSTPPTATSKHNETTAVLQPTNLFSCDLTTTNTSSTIDLPNGTPNYRRNQTQPIVLSKQVNDTIALPNPENDPFFVHPNFKNLTAKSQVVQPPESIAWRDQPIVAADQHLRPQSARLNNSFNFKPKPEPLDQSLLALLDPLLSNNAKAATPQQSTAPALTKKVEVPAKPAEKKPSVGEAKMINTAAVPRPQSSGQFKTAPSALNVLAFVAPTRNQQNNQQKVSVPPPTTVQPTATSRSAWTYLPPSTPTTASPSTTIQSSSSLADAISLAQIGNKPTNNGQQSSTNAFKVPAAIGQTTTTPKTTSSYASLLPPPSVLATSTSSTATSCSRLPPPSQLLLSGLKNEASEDKSEGAGPAFDPFACNSSGSQLNSGAKMANDPFNAKAAAPLKDSQKAPQQLFNIQNSSAGAYKTPSSTNNLYQPQQQMPNMLITQNNQQMFLSPSGIPFLLPTPLQQTPKQSTSSQPSSTSQLPIISLDELDVDSMVAKVKDKVDFATMDQCSKALRTAGYEVDAAIELLKVEKLMEMGLCPDRGSAVKVLKANEWNVNNAAISLVS